jgi:hypothetical protein
MYLLLFLLLYYAFTIRMTRKIVLLGQNCMVKYLALVDLVLLYINVKNLKNDKLYKGFEFSKISSTAGK